MISNTTRNKTQRENEQKTDYTNRHKKKLLGNIIGGFITLLLGINKK